MDERNKCYLQKQAATSYLSPFVKTFWQLQANSKIEQIQTIVPDGCIEIIIEIPNPVVRQSDYYPTSAVVAGQVKQGFQLTLPIGYSDQAHMTRELQKISGHSPNRMGNIGQIGSFLSDLTKTNRAFFQYKS